MDEIPFVLVFTEIQLYQYYLPPTYSLPGTKFQTAFNQALGTS